ncbi:MAG: hypothetical protein US83_C0014G0026 [Candidatus Falkowbacteria bacterium GW2011_GWC2_38_22]|uniref:EF-hand domain-containing protein n=1 Tax=Candidatus Falkowbacteria bacterium GW2011_GWE1_38_31 TaxID=1618638 RepID=A0A0G0MXK3_9BACT|nr:MAG: hypothetical protein US73_C0011G0026 [Candidatus Falkowbacteria bacterium GW2011_GWF2_38_1205]KKQ60684.1 MAG: hypothetical protein US83_C0014G0026 [Candidatus Falkowbacteria bacterium GW2011_GWC2_38_22]KKQ62824.1 MAG: hypothetical protein US84_C0011G0026 [Candidatus Falkowbacteria bacterium GW2011_GWF1_38_22]KKQ64936.1 MAG: hypothetical protein US87_C0011G0026 [Candidatus Falkowbacteria bacterium GW2011_GWE2_38_254]KKQ69656.1 MAG: hypothetical protein US91_C0011G0026 [Candidatus Falkowb
MFDHLEEKKAKEEKTEPTRQSGGGDLVLRNTIDRLTSGRVSVSSPFIATTHELENRLKKLEEKGRKRGRRFSIIGIVGGSAIALLIMYFGYVILTDVIYLTGKAGERTSEVLDTHRTMKKTLAEVASTTDNMNALINAELLPDNTINESTSSDSLLISDEIITEASSSSEILGNNIDTDNDGLTDEEENLLQTDTNNSDTDGDGYLDGEEVRGGYDPKNK